MGPLAQGGLALVVMVFVVLAALLVAIAARGGRPRPAARNQTNGTSTGGVAEVTPA